MVGFVEQSGMANSGIMDIAMMRRIQIRTSGFSVVDLYVDGNPSQIILRSASGYRVAAVAPPKSHNLIHNRMRIARKSYATRAEIVALTYTYPVVKVMGPGGAPCSG